ncbi:MAG: molybdenum cofactor guanylyltransferase [Anaerolineales bacterium]|jgi:molybdopterin-guanine dinucleotide biosynthesis protein A
MLTIAIQAGGQSSRMGRDKALVELDGRPLIEHVLLRSRDLADELLITTNNPENLAYLGIRMVADRLPGAGALHGLETALLAAQGEDVLLLACDAPFVSREVIKYLIAQRDHADVIIPQRAGRYEPLQALYNLEHCLPAVNKALRTGKKRMISFFPSVRVYPIVEETIAELDPTGFSFFNVNTEADLLEAEKILRHLDEQDKPHA